MKILIAILVALMMPQKSLSQSESLQDFFSTFEDIQVVPKGLTWEEERDFNRNHRTFSSAPLLSQVMAGNVLTEFEKRSFLGESRENRKYARVTKSQINDYTCLLLFYFSECSQEMGLELFVFHNDQIYDRGIVAYCCSNESLSFLIGDVTAGSNPFDDSGERIGLDVTTSIITSQKGEIPNNQEERLMMGHWEPKRHIMVLI